MADVKNIYQVKIRQIKNILERSGLSGLASGNFTMLTEPNPQTNIFLFNETESNSELSKYIVKIICNKRSSNSMNSQYEAQNELNILGVNVPKMLVAPQAVTIADEDKLGLINAKLLNMMMKSIPAVDATNDDTIVNTAYEKGDVPETNSVIVIEEAFPFAYSCQTNTMRELYDLLKKIDTLSVDDIKNTLSDVCAISAKNFHFGDNVKFNFDKSSPHRGVVFIDLSLRGDNATVKEFDTSEIFAPIISKAYLGLIFPDIHNMYFVAGGAMRYTASHPINSDLNSYHNFKQIKSLFTHDSYVDFVRVCASIIDKVCEALSEYSPKLESLQDKYTLERDVITKYYGAAMNAVLNEAKALGVAPNNTKKFNCQDDTER